MNMPMPAAVKPRFEIEELEGEAEVEKLVPVTKEVKKGSKTFISTKWEREKVKVPAGYMVYLPNGSSYRVKSHEELVRLELARDPDLVDMETGEAVPVPRPMSLKKDIDRKTRPLNKGKVAVSAAASVAAATEGA